MFRVASRFRAQKAVSELRRTAPVTLALVSLNIVIFVLVLFHPNIDAFFATWGLTPAQLTGNFGLQALATVFTSMFLHGGWLHLGLNMFLLWGLGRMLEAKLGGRAYAMVYLFAGVGGAALQILLGPDSTIPMIGASGAISGLIGAAAMLTPRQRVWVVTPLTLFIPVTVKMRTLGWAYVALQLVGMAGADPFGGGIAYAAHLGGYFAGFYVVAWAVQRVRTGRAKNRRTQTRRETDTGAHPGAAPGPGYRSFTVTDAHGRTFVFHEPCSNC